MNSPQVVAEPLGVTFAEACFMLGCTAAQGKKLLSSGELNTYTIGRAQRVTVDSLRRYVERHSSSAAQAAA